jgi:SAM-dependent methyltransferase
MNPGEHEIMARVEDHHWWYQGLRDAMARCLEQPDLRLPSRPRVLDAGCGTGATLRFLGDLLTPSYLGGFDRSEEALRLAAAKAPDADLYLADIRSPTVRESGLDLVVSLDVIYVPGAESCMEGLAQLVSALGPGGLFVLNLPAYSWLFSEHDVAIHTHERYTARRVRVLLDRLGLQAARLSYRLFFLFPAVVLARLPSMLRALPAASAARSDLHIVPSAATNRALLGTLRVENRFIARGGQLPWGSSVFVIGKKP